MPTEATIKWRAVRLARARPRRPVARFLCCRRAAIVIIAVCAYACASGTRAAPPASGEITVLVSQAGGKALPGTVLMVHRLDAAPHPAAPVHAIMDQLNREFVPHVLVVPVGSTVSFPNSDKVRHEVYSFSPTHRFQLPLYSGKPYPPQRFDRVGLVTLGCNIHDWMLAYILVTDAEYFGSSDSAGRWSVRDVPPGRYRLEWWHPRLGGLSQNAEREISVSADHPTEVQIEIDSGLRPAALSAHNHSWDAY